MSVELVDVRLIVVDVKSVPLSTTSLTHSGRDARARVVVNSAPSHITVPEEVRALGLGSFDLTITCRDDEKIVSSTAKIEVFGPQSLPPPPS